MDCFCKLSPSEEVEEVDDTEEDTDKDLRRAASRPS